MGYSPSLRNNTQEVVPHTSLRGIPAWGTPALEDVMYKIPTLFERDETTRKVVARWNLAVDRRALERATPTEKIDGYAVLIQAGRLYARQTIGEKDEPVPGWIAAEQPMNGQIAGWIPCRRDNPRHKWHWEAWDNLGEEFRPDRAQMPPPAQYTWLPDGTYELVGPKVHGNVYGLDGHRLWTHGETKVYMAPLDRDPAVALGYLREFLVHAPVEGLVWWTSSKAIAKIKARDYGIPWPRPVPARPVASTVTGA